MIVFVCSPYAGDTQKNVEAARKYCRFVVDKGHVPIAPHLLFPQFIDEETERDLGFRLGIRLLSICDEIWVFTNGRPDGISSGMAVEIDLAKENLIPIREFSTSMFEEEKPDDI